MKQPPKFEGAIRSIKEMTEGRVYYKHYTGNGDTAKFKYLKNIDNDKYRARYLKDDGSYWDTTDYFGDGGIRPYAEDCWNQYNYVTLFKGEKMEQKKLTLEEALKITAELWDWLSEPGNTEKNKWEGWKVYGEMANWCPCCQYVEDIGEDDACGYGSCANVCPLKSLWPEGCEGTNTVYNKWKHEKRIGEYKAASIIRDAALKELDKIAGKLTREKALQITKELWQWLAEDETRRKLDWSGWKKYGSMSDNCACCHYVNTNYPDVIERCVANCPLKSVWPDGCGHGEDSPYAEWADSTKSPRERKEAATKIWKGADRELQKSECFTGSIMVPEELTKKDVFPVNLQIDSIGELSYLYHKFNCPTGMNMNEYSDLHSDSGKNKGVIELNELRGQDMLGNFFHRIDKFISYLEPKKCDKCGQEIKEKE